MSTGLHLRRPRYADVAATLALVLAMSGAAYAVATTAAPNSVDTAAIQNGAVTTPKLATEAVSSAKIAPAAVTAGKLATAAVGTDNLVDASVTHRKIAGNAVRGVNVANHTLTVADLTGANVSESISFTLPAHGCGYLKFAASGAKVGQAAVLTWLGTTNPPQGVMVGPLKVTSAGQVVASACNVTGSKVVGSAVKVRVTTLG